jgi:hypothetical protein
VWMKAHVPREPVDSLKVVVGNHRDERGRFVAESAPVTEYAVDSADDEDECDFGDVHAAPVTDYMVEGYDDTCRFPLETCAVRNESGDMRSTLRNLLFSSEWRDPYSKHWPFNSGRLCAVRWFEVRGTARRVGLALLWSGTSAALKSFASMRRTKTNA